MYTELDSQGKVKMQQFNTNIIRNEKISEDFYLLDFEWTKDLVKPKPGQFLTIRVSNTTVPLLRRPFAVSNFDKKTNIASFIYQKRGVGTEILVGKKANGQLDVLGPLGSSFPLLDAVDSYIVVAGGVGLGPMLYTAKTLLEHGKQVLFVLGCRDKSFLPDDKLFGNIFDSSLLLREDTFVICTDDGSHGFHGTTVDFLKTLEADVVNRSAVFACGPTPMLKGCHEFSVENKNFCYVSMEQVMACGIGACMGCVIKIHGEKKYARVCKEGPVFESEAIQWT